MSRSTLATTSFAAAAFVAAPEITSASAISALLDSSISASRYRICPRLYGVRFAQPGPAFAAASTALRRSFRVHCGTLPSSPPSLFPLPSSRTGNTRPLSERMNSPPTYTFGVFITGMRAISDHLPVVHQSLPSAFTSEAGLLVPAERRRRIELVEGVRPDDTGLEQCAHLEDPRSLVGPHAGRQPVHGVVRLFDGFLERAEGEDAEHRPEDLFARDAM